jgi:uncharacterized protein YkwD/uncharacterized membrane protein required for colicin V production
LSFNLADLNWLDWLVVAMLALSALEGTRRGLLLGALDLLGAAVGFGVAIVGERPVGNALNGYVPALAPPVAHLVAFLGLLIGVQIVISATVGGLVAAAARFVAFTPLGVVDRFFGMVPGLVRGLITVTLLLLPFALLPLLPSVSQALQQSAVADRLVGGALEFMPVVEARLGQDIEGGLPSLVVAPPESETGTQRPLPVGPPTGELAPDPGAEQQMLDLVNGERASRGLKALAADDRLRDVARAHSLDMFQQDYFSHNTPEGSSPFDRMRRAGIAFVIAGENLAYAPNVQIAHEGLMNSPGHRANILRPEFGRVGIGIIRSQAQGSMFTQDFTN